MAFINLTFPGLLSNPNPVPPLPVLGKEDAKHVRVLWKTANDKAELTEEIRGTRILGEDLRFLSGTEWLNDKVINFYSNLIQTRNNTDESLPNIWIGRTNMYNMIKKRGPEKVKRWTNKVRPNVFAKDMLFFPMNLNDTHWCCGCINIQKKRFELYDSLGVSERVFYGHMRAWLEMEANHRGEKLNLDEWTNYDEDATIPRQDNFYDCGVFVLMYLSHLAANKPFRFTQADVPNLRLRIAHEILKNKVFPL